VGGGRGNVFFSRPNEACEILFNASGSREGVFRFVRGFSGGGAQSQLRVYRYFCDAFWPARNEMGPAHN